jgi:hypothetical protein
MRDDRLHQLIDAFLASGRSSQWLRGDYLEIYLRRGLRGLTPDVRGVATIELANLRDQPIEFQLQGIFPAFLTHLESQGKAVFIENIGPKPLQWYFTRRGYKRYQFAPYDFCCYRMP